MFNVHHFITKANPIKMEGVKYSSSFRNLILMLLLLGYWANNVQAEVKSNSVDTSSNHINTTSAGDKRDSKCIIINY